MSDLPSREEAAKRASQLRAEGLSFSAEYLALDGIASGRLVDREAIDREAAVLRLPEVVDNQGRYVKTGGEIVDLVLAAAIGDTG